jgi:tetratricopeptide (TPR) repeat protein
MKHFDLLEAYHLGKMSDSEARDFEQSIGTDPGLKQEWEDYKLAKQVSGVLAYEDAKQKISGLKQTPMHVVHRQKPQRQILRIAAAVVALVVFGFLFSQVNYSDSAIASRHYNSISTSMRSPQSDGAAKLIDTGKYEEAVALLQQANEGDPISQSLLAEALTKMERYPDAIAVYTELAADPQNINREGAEFALAVLYLKTGEHNTATDLISRIAASDEHDFRFEARKLDSQLKSFWRKLVI